MVNFLSIYFQALGWLMLGALTLNAFHEAVQRTSMYGKLDGVVTAECEILLKIFNNMYDAVECLLKHVKEALKFLVEVYTVGVVIMTFEVTMSSLLETHLRLLGSEEYLMLLNSK